NGFPFGIFSIFLGFVIGAVYSLLLMAVKKKTMKDTIPFGPFLIIGSVVTLLFGSAIWEWYSNLSAFVI
ncbi:MAG TPA: prepilin peptidase, partial [bacterium]|nr:prepilin peptidase [bacterium]